MFSAKSNRSLMLCSVVFILVAGCTNLKYTVNIDSSLQNAKIQPSTIAVFPVDEMEYIPPTGCIPTPASTIASGRSRYQNYWNQHVKSILSKSFGSQNWVFLDSASDVLQSGEIDFGAIKELSSQSYRAEKINAIAKDVVEFGYFGDNKQMLEQLQKLKNTTNADYAVVFIQPALSGEIQTTYSYNQYGGSTSSTTYYTADVKVLVWECSTGKLLFASGGWNKSSSFCFVIPPEMFSIQGADAKFKKNLQLIISRLLDYDIGKNVAQARLQ